MTGYRSGYGNPLNVLLFRERVTCKGCVHMAELWGMKMCAKGKWSGISNMKRCKEYNDTTTKGKE